VAAASTSWPPPADRPQPWDKFGATADAIIDEALCRPEISGFAAPGFSVRGAYSSETDARRGSLAHDLAALFPDAHQRQMLEIAVDKRADELPEAQRKMVNQLLPLSARPVRPAEHKWFQLVCQGCSSRKDGRGELGLAVRCTCV